MNVVIIETKQEEQNCLCKLLRLFCPNITIIGCANSSEEGIHLIQASQPDLIFIDSQIPKLEDINSIIRKSNQEFHTIFISDRTTPASHRKNNNQLSHLLKPIHPDSLVECVKTARHQLMKQLYPNYKENKAKKQGAPDRIGIPTANGIKYLFIRNILYLRARDNYTEIVQEKGKPLLITKPLKSFEGPLKGTSFTRAHQSYLVNLEKVIELQRTDGGLLLLQNNHCIPISRSKKDTIKKRLNETWQLV